MILFWIQNIKLNALWNTVVLDVCILCILAKAVNNFMHTENLQSVNNMHTAKIVWKYVVPKTSLFRLCWED